MSEIILFLNPTSLFHNAFLGSFFVGLFLPLIGVFFMLRRMVLLGVALPQISAAGISLVFFLEGLGIHWTLHAGEANDRFLALAGAFLLTLGALLWLGILERRGEGTSESRIGAAYALAFAAAILLVSANPSGKMEILNLLHGEIVSITKQDFHLLLGAYAALAVLLWIFRNELLLVSFDRESAQVMGKKVLVWDVLLYVLIGWAISMSVLVVGPMMTFSFLVIPPLAARRFCNQMETFFLLSSVLGGLGGIAGFILSYQLDWPLSPTVILVASSILAGSFLIKWGITLHQTTKTT